MPANLTPQFHAARNKYHAASNTEERILALEDMYRTIPKHKGTDKMQADIKHQLAKLRHENSKEQQHGKHRPFWLIDKQGAGRLILIGPANSGKSSFITQVSNAPAEVAPYPYTTQHPIPGMAPFRNIHYQIIDLPPFVRGKPSWMIDLTRTAELILLFLDLSSDDLLSDLEMLTTELRDSHIHVISPISQETDMQDDLMAEDALFIDPNTRKAIIVANKADLDSTSERLTLLNEACELFDLNLPIHPICALDGAGISDLFSAIFDYLELVRIYTKAPGKIANFNKPVVVTRGTTLIELATGIHKDFAENLKYARVWGPTTFDGQRIAKDYILNDEDIVELHLKS